MVICRRGRCPMPAMLWGLVFALGVILGGPQTASAANIVHFQPAAGPHNYIVTDHPAVLEHLQPSFWILGSYGLDPLVYRDEAGNITRRVVDHAVTADATFAIGLFERFELGLGLPVVYLNGPGFDGQGLSSFTPGDLRLLGKVLLTPWNDGFVAAFRLRSDLPLAQLAPNGSTFAGEGNLPNLTPALSAGFNSEWFRLGLDVGYLLRSPSQLGDEAIGHEITYGLGAEFMVLSKELYATVDLFGRAAPAGLNQMLVDSSVRVVDHFPLEAIAGLKYFIGPVVLTGGAGTGVVPDYGSPRLRVFIGIGYLPRAKKEPPVIEPEETKPVVAIHTAEVIDDRDNDGIIDKEDQCPDEPEDKDQWQDDDGCPDPDNDGDKILDVDDKCPDKAEDYDQWLDEDGCPDPDNDVDQILDVDDKCPDEPEDFDKWQDDDGCPDPDNDDDGIADAQDECPNDPETKNNYKDDDGCPDGRRVTVVLRREKIEILDKVYFALNSDRILPRSFALLDQVAKVLREHTELDAVTIEGHTDSSGGDVYNKKLSQRRAESVMRYLVKANVDERRLSAEGFGEEKPIASNSNRAGRAMNRRVEFRINNTESSVREAPEDGTMDFDLEDADDDLLPDGDGDE